MKFQDFVCLRVMLPVVLLMTLSLQALGQSPQFNDVMITQGSSGDMTIDWLDGGSAAAGVQITNILFSDDSVFEDVTIYVTDFFTGEEEVCSTTGTTIAPNVSVSCNSTFTTIALEQTALQALGDVIDYARARILVPSDAVVQQVAVSADWQSFDSVGGDLDAGDISGSISIEEATSILEVTPQEIDFPDIFTGSTSPFEEVSIANVGEDGVSLWVDNIDLTGPFALAEGGDCVAPPFSLDDSQSCTQRVVFSPTADGPAGGTLTVFSDAGEVINATVALSGEGVPPPVGLVFDQSPDYGVAGGPLYGAVVVQVVDTNGDLFVGDSTTVVEISLVNDPAGSAVLSGTTELIVSNGVAVFNNLSIDQVGIGFELRGSDQSGTLSSGDSAAFDVLPPNLFQDRFEDLD